MQSFGAQSGPSVAWCERPRLTRRRRAEKGCQSFVSGSDVPPIMKEAGHESGRQAAKLAANAALGRKSGGEDRRLDLNNRGRDTFDVGGSSQVTTSTGPPLLPMRNRWLRRVTDSSRVISLSDL